MTRNLAHCLRLLQMWFWFVAAIAYAFLEVLERRDPSFKEEYRAASAERPAVMAWLEQQYNALLSEAKARPSPKCQ
jgi:hypothetical protein